jgi:hypothetical protein
LRPVRGDGAASGYLLTGARLRVSAFGSVRFGPFQV